MSTPPQPVYSYIKENQYGTAGVEPKSPSSGWHGREEDVCSVAEFALVRGLLHAGVDVIVDDTNLDPAVVEAWETLAKYQLAQFRVQDFTHVPVDECIVRDALRPEGERVGPDKIWSMYRRHLAEVRA